MHYEIPVDGEPVISQVHERLDKFLLDVTWCGLNKNFSSLDDDAKEESVIRYIRAYIL